MHTNSDALDKFAQKNNIAMILLFGSRVTGEHREDSDMDLGLLFSDNGYDYTAVIRELMNIFPDVALDIVVLNKSDPLLNFQVISNYEIIYCPVSEVFLQFYTETIKKYHDMQKIFKLADNYLENFAGGVKNGTITCNPPKVN
ncbi:MAG: nucleotidyltransferase domain-containing protein [Dethiobacter sp.]|jgi:predicted nucleotidyltransferase|nr:nucleotidyltransferase domain-containing protein [Dethiobacter sp.]